ncbi:hypothetical protein HQ520_17150 [bacterium]|nr:hypothetical protein [bacterium]
MSSRHAFISVTSKAIAILAIALLVGWMCPARAADVLVEAEDFQFYGIWQRTSAGEASGDFQIQVMGGPKKEPDAITLIELPETGTYNIWVSSRDYTDHEPGERRFRILIDDIPADIESGAHGHDGYYWEKVKTMPLEKGRHVLAANDTTAHYGRFDAIILTTSDANPNTLDERALQKWRIEPITLKTTPPDIFANVPLLVPAGEMEEVARLDNGQVRMIFQKYKDAQGKIQVVRHTELKVGGDWR